MAPEFAAEAQLFVTTVARTWGCLEAGASNAGKALSAREQECLTAAARGETYEKIGLALVISRSAVDKALASARSKLGVPSTAAAIALLMRNE